MSDTDGIESNTDGNADADNAAGAGGETSTATKATGADEFKPPTSQAELNRLIADRVKRAEAKYADYSDAIKKAKQFDAITEAQKTELQKLQERAEAAEKRAQEFETAEQQRQAEAEAARQVEDWKAKVSKSTGIPVGVLRGSTEADIQAHAESLKELLPDPRKGGYVPGEGRVVPAGTGDPRQQFADIIRNS